MNTNLILQVDQSFNWVGKIETSASLKRDQNLKQKLKVRRKVVNSDNIFTSLAQFSRFVSAHRGKKLPFWVFKNTVLIFSNRRYMTGIYYYIFCQPQSFTVSLEVPGFIFASRNSLAISKWLTKRTINLNGNPRYNKALFVTTFPIQ